jgi:hypothetical protein
MQFGFMTLINECLAPMCHHFTIWRKLCGVKQFIAKLQSSQSLSLKNKTVKFRSRTPTLRTKKKQTLALISMIILELRHRMVPDLHKEEEGINNIREVLRLEGILKTMGKCIQYREV